MLSKRFIEGLILVLIASLLLQQWVIGLLCMLTLVPLAAAKIWQRWALHALIYERNLSEHHVFPDSEIEMTTRITNRKLLPLVRLDLADTIPDGLEIIGVKLFAVRSIGSRALLRSLSLGWYEAVTRRYQVRCMQRGAYQLGPVRLESGDPFGFFRQEREQRTLSQLVVYPRLLPPQELGFEMRQLLGDIRAQNRLLADPSRTVGVRDYHREDPLKSIHWNATARRGMLQTRVYEPTTALDIMCFLDPSTYSYIWEGIDPVEGERLISMAATICKALIGAGHSVGLWTNAVTAGGGGTVRVASAHSPQQLGRILETLARLRLYTGPAMAHLLASARSMIASGATVVLISAQANTATRAGLLRLRSAGHPVVWISLGAEKPVLPGATVYHIPPARKETQ
ncbi:MAG: DUF58 domain-containing protein [Herpetosiphonaceae bacterium]|nr:DUF58 domain-containing protein [Herpetosiphonaceae bacterium]